jgi:hypothetical protein
LVIDIKKNTLPKAKGAPALLVEIEIYNNLVFSATIYTEINKNNRKIRNQSRKQR